MPDILELRKKLIQKVKKKVQETLGEKEAGIIKASNIIDDLDSIFNLLAEHTIDWYSYHFPELKREIQDSETQLKLIAHIGERKNFSEKNILEQYNNERKAKNVFELSKKSIGAELDKKETDEIKLLALNALNLKEERKFLTKFMQEKMSATAPVFSELCGSTLAAKFLAKTGSLKKLAMLPSTAIQVMGAEKALFAHLKNKSKPPKYGYLYSHPLVKQAKPKAKGKLARALAAKLSIAAKADYFGTGKKLLPELKEEIEKKVQSLNG